MERNYSGISQSDCCRENWMTVSRSTQASRILQRSKARLCIVTAGLSTSVEKLSDCNFDGLNARHRVVGLCPHQADVARCVFREIGKHLFITQGDDDLRTCHFVPFLMPSIWYKILLLMTACRILGNVLRRSLLIWGAAKVWL